ncbi:MAG: hypothetical protein A2W90_13720 [Bacteroidetes bacterium GWF2_42_66]|nr:MAG: hypothetical protein A2W92_14435 [Bacteroidetes bacterium GWA2_42_15]OFX97316.1 MAG: hypothetical protein A2W89_00895 [Bacteroidetes bacterium GWE2_42_39]OFY39953.1 MAG: hypothetical protein A2W90_13720 [Bacteroidetes bacterium GWF2_42_66]HBL78140.1 hypothetical protein [Prolixibacteraceae bacterium]HCR91107.1 hypothetical protein [Prolixibacteraceae bacterium]
MSENLNAQTYERIFSILLNGVPKLFEAEHFVEKENRISPYPVFIESRDVLSHLRDIAADINSKENVEKNIIEIEEHLRRGIAETYQEHYEYLSSNVFRSYGKYKSSFMKFENLLGLRAKHAPLHSKINSILKSAQSLWMEGRNMKNNDISSKEFLTSISKFKEASEMVSTIDNEVETIFNNFYKRGIITSFIAIFSISIILILAAKLFVV